MTAVMTAKDFKFSVSSSLSLPGMPFGDDEYFICYGHGWTAVDLSNYVEIYLSSCGFEGDELKTLHMIAFNNGIVERWARIINPDDDPDDWMISWSDNNSQGPGAFPVTYMAMQ